MADNFEKQHEIVLARWARALEKERAKAGASKEAIKQFLKNALAAEGQKGNLAKEMINARQNPGNARELEAMNRWGGMAEDVTGYEDLPWNK